jgi:hypothetical protein
MSDWSLARTFKFRGKYYATICVETVRRLFLFTGYRGPPSIGGI